MRRRLAELLLLLAVIALLPLSEGTPPPATSPPQLTDVTLRYSSEGGCFNVANFYFDLQGSSWVATLNAFSSFRETDPPKAGVYRATGSLGPDDLQTFLTGLERAEVWKLYGHSSSVGADHALLLRVNGRTKLVRGLKYRWDPNGCEDLVLTFLREQLPGQIEQTLREKHRQGLAPDGPPWRRPQDWPATPL